MIKKIAVIDDEQDILNILNNFLSGDERLDITTFSNPIAAVDIVKNGTFDLVLLDIMMPQMNGIEFLKEVKDLSGDTKVMMMTAYSTKDKIKKCKKFGAIDYITKPFISLKDIKNRILKQLNLKDTKDD